MIYSRLKGTVMPMCKAKKGAFMAPNIYELQYYCMSVRYKECPVFKQHRSRTSAKREKKEIDNDAVS